MIKGLNGLVKILIATNKAICEVALIIAEISPVHSERLRKAMDEIAKAGEREE